MTLAGAGQGPGVLEDGIQGSRSPGGLLDGLTLGPIWTLIGPVWDPLWTHYGPIMDPFGTHLGPIMDPLWTHYGPIVDPLWTQNTQYPERYPESRARVTGSSILAPWIQVPLLPGSRFLLVPSGCFAG